MCESRTKAAALPTGITSPPKMMFSANFLAAAIATVISTGFTTQVDAEETEQVAKKAQ